MLLFGLSLLAIGCGAKEIMTMRTWAKPSASSDTSEASPSFVELVAVGRAAEEGAPKLLGRTQFFPGHRRTSAKVVGPLLDRLAHLQSAPVEFAYIPVGRDLGGEGRAGWRLLGREAAWEIADAAAEKDFARAIARFRVATRLGFDLTAGGAADASLGLAIADDARRAIAPGLAGFPAASLDELAEVTESSLKERPPLVKTVRNEAANMRIMLQELQDAYGAGRLTEAAKAYGPTVADDAGRLASQPPAEAARYFAGIGEEIETIEGELAKDAGLPAPQRTWEPEKIPPRGRTLRRSITLTIGPLLRMDDVTVARTRLLVAECRLRARTLRGQALPKTLASIGEFEDPFSGYTLVYRRDGKEWSVYSVGADGKDDGGETGIGGLAPDLRLEK